MSVRTDNSIPLQNVVSTKPEIKGSTTGEVEKHTISPSTNDLHLQNQTTDVLDTIKDTLGSLPDVTVGFFRSLSKSPIEETHPNDSGPLRGIKKSLTLPTLPGALEGLKSGESRHKTVIREAFNNLTTGVDDNSPNSGKDWKARNDDIHVPQNITSDAKIANDIFVAEIMADPVIMNTAANFALDMSKLYGQGGDRAHVLAGANTDMSHLWPDQNTNEKKNQDYRGWNSVISGFVTNPFKENDALSVALKNNVPTLEVLVSRHDKPYSLEETSYILRTIGMLRDVMKVEKGDVAKSNSSSREPGLIKLGLSEGHKFSGAPDLERKNRIKVTGETKEGAQNRDNPMEHEKSRSPLRWIQPLGTKLMQDTSIYKSDRASFDYMQGTSGTTLDMINFFMTHGKTINEATQLMQAFYAQWHFIAPDGNAHSQIESMDTMLQYLHKSTLQVPIMTPIRTSDDIVKMNDELFVKPLTTESPGFLGFDEKKTEKKETT